MNLLEGNAMNKRYGVDDTTVQALKNVSISIPKGKQVSDGVLSDLGGSPE